MKTVAWLRSVASTLFRRPRVEREMDEEIRAHIERRAEELERSGVAREQAKRRAQIEFGGVERFKEECGTAALQFWDQG
jgi:hypothetical protein